MENMFVREDLTKVFITHQKLKAREVLFIWTREVGIHNKIMDDYYKIKSDELTLYNVILRHTLNSLQEQNKDI